VSHELVRPTIIKEFQQSSCVLGEGEPHAGVFASAYRRAQVPAVDEPDTWALWIWFGERKQPLAH
jgi:hypothetical protein